LEYNRIYKEHQPNVQVVPIFGIEPDRPSSPFLQFSRSNANHNQPTEVTGTPV
jgi:hypothetical protein